MTKVLDNYPPSTLHGVGLWGRKNPRIIVGENYPRHQIDYMQLFLFSGVNFLKITITITFLISIRIDSREMYQFLGKTL